jgi:aryl-alcohol dehydrogenase-like predicted oxidoreductase
MQNQHSLVYREEEREMFPTLNHFGVGIIPWAPLARGLLTRPSNGETTTKRGDDLWVCFVLATLTT